MVARPPHVVRSIMDAGNPAYRRIAPGERKISSKAAPRPTTMRRKAPPPLFLMAPWMMASARCGKRQGQGDF